MYYKKACDLNWEESCLLLQSLDIDDLKPGNYKIDGRVPLMPILDLFGVKGTDRVVSKIIYIPEGEYFKIIKKTPNRNNDVWYKVKYRHHLGFINSGVLIGSNLKKQKISIKYPLEIFEKRKSIVKKNHKKRKKKRLRKKRNMVKVSPKAPKFKIKKEQPLPIKEEYVPKLVLPKESEEPDAKTRWVLD